MIPNRSLVLESKTAAIVSIQSEITMRISQPNRNLEPEHNNKLNQIVHLHQQHQEIAEKTDPKSAFGPFRSKPSDTIQNLSDFSVKRAWEDLRPRGQQIRAQLSKIDTRHLAMNGCYGDNGSRYRDVGHGGVRGYYAPTQERGTNIRDKGRVKY
ncbi:hypothetical protein Tco_1214670 [Tanacetum coccineum]